MSTPSGNPGGTSSSGGTTTAGDPLAARTTLSASSGTTGSHSISLIQPQVFDPAPNWPSDWLLKNKESSNWDEWNRRVTQIVDQRQFSDYLDGSLPCPDPSTHPDEAKIW